jgi:dTDP-4-amino-4,6-dideoxygalactose transaminase
MDLGYKKGSFPVAERTANEVMSLPMFPHMTLEQVETVVQALKESL